MGWIEGLIRLYLTFVLLRIAHVLIATGATQTGLSLGLGRSRGVRISPIRCAVDIAVAAAVIYAAYLFVYRDSRLVLFQVPGTGVHVILGMPWSLLPLGWLVLAFGGIVAYAFRQARAAPVTGGGRATVRLRRVLLGAPRYFRRRRPPHEWLRTECRSAAMFLASSVAGTIADKLAGEEGRALFGQASPGWLAGFLADDSLNVLDEQALDPSQGAVRADQALMFVVLLTPGSPRLLIIDNEARYVDPFDPAVRPRRVPAEMSADGLYVHMPDGELIIQTETWNSGLQLRVHRPQCFTGKFHSCPEARLILPVDDPAVLLRRKPLHHDGTLNVWYLFKAVSSGYQFVLTPRGYTIGRYNERATSPRDHPGPTSGSWLATIARGRLRRSEIAVEIGGYRAKLRYNAAMQGWLGTELGPSGHASKIVLWVASSGELAERYDTQSLSSLVGFRRAATRSVGAPFS